MKHIISSTALVMTLSLTPALAAANSYGDERTPHERCKRDEDNKQVLGGLAGAVVGGVFGSQVSGNGARSEGSAIGAVLGGLAGVGIADKVIDCDPVYETDQYQTSGASYPTTTSYPATTYPAGSYPTSSTSYGSNTVYGSISSQPYSTASTQPYYEDRVTVSNHPVYSDPTYGAGGLNQGTTYSSGTVSYPPSGNNTQYASHTYSTTPAYSSTPTYETTSTYGTASRGYGSTPTYGTTQGARVYAASTSPVYHQTQTVVQPVTQQTVYRATPQPTYGQSGHHRSRQSNLHRHGRYSCDMHH